MKASLRHALNLFVCLFVCAFYTFPYIQNNLHLALFHNHDIPHSHGQSGAVYYAPQDQLDIPSPNNNPNEHPHVLKESPELFIRSGNTHLTDTTETPITTNSVPFELWSQTLTQPQLESSPYQGLPVRPHCQEIVLTHPNKAPPLV